MCGCVCAWVHVFGWVWGCDLRRPNRLEAPLARARRVLAAERWTIKTYLFLHEILEEARELRVGVVHGGTLLVADALGQLTRLCNERGPRTVEEFVLTL